ncbi:MAG TPA: BON domain-containing protein [Anaerolineae bacterium]|nr:BON domain-containing protein [Anaerolineae bacterium]
MHQVDSTLATRVMEALLRDPRTGEAAIDVSSAGGALTLSGRVSSEGIRQAAEDIARRQKGVITVINDLDVASHDEPPVALPDDDETLPIKVRA